MSFGAFKPEPWMADAVCAQVDSELFFPELGGSTKAAKAICAQCPTRRRCLEFALEHNEVGVWGGLSNLERARLRKEPA